MCLVMPVMEAKWEHFKSFKIKSKISGIRVRVRSPQVSFLMSTLISESDPLAVTWSLPISLVYLDSEPQGSAFLPPWVCKFARFPLHTILLFFKVWVLGMQLGSSCLHSICFTNQSTSPTQHLNPGFNLMRYSYHEKLYIVWTIP